MSYFKHRSAIVDEGARVGGGTRIWHFVHICDGAFIGEDASLGQNVFVGRGAVIGDRCKIQNNVSVYDGVVLECDVFCGPSAVFTNIRNPRAEVSRRKEYQKTLIRQGATLGANCTVICGVTVGAYAFVGAGAVVTKDVPEYALVKGVPAKQAGWMSGYGELLDLPINGYGKTICKHTGVCYVLQGSRLLRSDPNEE